MSNLNDFLSRIQTDYTFYFQLRQNPEEVLTSYKLTSEEKAAVTDSREQLWSRVGRSSSYWKIGCNYVMLESDGLEFNPAAALQRPAIRDTIDEICNASAENDRLASVLALMEQLG